MLFLSGLFIGIIIGWTIGNVIPQKTNFPLFIKKVLAYFPCRALWMYHKTHPTYYFSPKIHAIKKYREITHEGLKESKEQVERWFE